MAIERATISPFPATVARAADEPQSGVSRGWSPSLDSYVPPLRNEDRPRHGSAARCPRRPGVTGPIPDRLLEFRDLVASKGWPVFFGAYPADRPIPDPVRQLELRLPFLSGTEVICAQSNNTMWRTRYTDPHTGESRFTNATHAPDKLRYALDFVLEHQARGTPVTSVAPGIAYAYGGARENQPDNWGYGNFVLVDHGNGYASMYAHLEEIGVMDGQRVDGSTVLGTMGATGNAGSPHLHFQLVHLTRTPDPATEAHQWTSGSTDPRPSPPFDHYEAVPFEMWTGRCGEIRRLHSTEFENNGYGLFPEINGRYIAPSIQQEQDMQVTPNGNQQFRPVTIPQNIAFKVADVLRDQNPPVSGNPGVDVSNYATYFLSDDRHRDAGLKEILVSPEVQPKQFFVRTRQQDRGGLVETWKGPYELTPLNSASPVGAGAPPIPRGIAAKVFAALESQKPNAFSDKPALIEKLDYKQYLLSDSRESCGTLDHIHVSPDAKHFYLSAEGGRGMSSPVWRGPYWLTQGAAS